MGVKGLHEHEPTRNLKCADNNFLFSDTGLQITATSVTKALGTWKLRR